MADVTGARIWPNHVFFESQRGPRGCVSWTMILLAFMNLTCPLVMNAYPLPSDLILFHVSAITPKNIFSATKQPNRIQRMQKAAAATRCDGFAPKFAALAVPSPRAAAGTRHGSIG